MSRGRSSDAIAEIKRVISLEARTLEQLSRAVNGAFEKAVRLMAACRGKVIVTGIGKSGLIAQKVAATLSSTGTPALYLHPAEGLHGDLGIVQRGDLVLALGKSGESDELNALLPSLKRIGVKIVALTAVRDSTLARAADVVLLTPIEREACPLNLAPTCSTTAALAAGDGLAVALMKRRGFEAGHFALLHPGGQLGRRLTLRVRDVMRSGNRNPVVSSRAGMRGALAEMTRQQAGAVSVVDGRGRLVGLLTDYDVRRVLESGGDVLSRPLASVMNARPTTVRPDTMAAEATALMTERTRPFSLLPVVDGRGKAVGLLHIHDLRAKGL